jgi:hypothetical protein
MADRKQSICLNILNGGTEFLREIYAKTDLTHDPKRTLRCKLRLCFPSNQTKQKYAKITRDELKQALLIPNTVFSEYLYIQMVEGKLGLEAWGMRINELESRDANIEVRLIEVWMWKLEDYWLSIQLNP